MIETAYGMVSGVGQAYGAASGMEGPQRVAALLLAMDREVAQSLLRHFSPEEIRQVTIAAAKLGAVPAASLEHIVEAFRQEFAATSGLYGDETHARDLVSSAVTPELLTSYLEAASDAGPVNLWKGIAGLPEKFLNQFLSEEHPLVVTYILSRLDSQLASRIVSGLPRELRNATLVRLISPPTLSPTATAILERALRDVLLGGVTDGSVDDARIRIADIINGLDPAEAEDVMKALEEARPQDAKVLRNLLFSFFDLSRLTKRALALLLDKIPSDLVVMALKGTDANFREIILSAMAARARRQVENELNTATTAKAADINKARKQIVQIVLGMSQKGEIELPSNDLHDGMNE